MLRLLGLAGLLMLPQLPTPAPASDNIVTLHAYSTLVQIPVLVLSDKRMRLAPLTPDQFTVNIDGGPYFHPRRVRQEGSDAIRLILLLDAGANTASLLSSFGPALNDLSSSLTDRDVVSISVLRNGIFSQTQGAPFTEAWRNTLAGFVQQQLSATGGTAIADSPTRLWNAIAIASSRFGTTTSRRVILVVTDSKPGGAGAPIRQLRNLDTSLGITIFALRQQTETEARKNSYVLNRDAFAYARPQSEDADALTTVTEATGGLTLEMRDHPLAEGLMRVLRMVRERYILEFVPPSKAALGVHPIDVRTRERRLFVRAAGISVTPPDPAIAKDPNTVPSDPTAEAPMGTRRVLTH